jgi:hypothetical protein
MKPVAESATQEALAGFVERVTLGRPVAMQNKSFTVQLFRSLDR